MKKVLSLIFVLSMICTSAFAEIVSGTYRAPINLTSSYSRNYRTSNISYTTSQINNINRNPVNNYVSTTQYNNTGSYRKVTLREASQKYGKDSAGRIYRYNELDRRADY